MLFRSRNSLIQGGFSEEANRLAVVSAGPTSRQAWEDYARATFEAHAKALPPDKLRFLQYVNPQNLAWWRTQRHRGAVLLGKAAVSAGVCATGRSAPPEFY